MSSPRKVNYVSFDQHRETVPDNPSRRMLSQFMEVFYCHPDCVTQCEDVPRKAKYRRNIVQNLVFFRRANETLIGAGENEFLW
jgi:hypothetical protein